MSAPSLVKRLPAKLHAVPCKPTSIAATPEATSSSSVHKEQPLMFRTYNETDTLAVFFKKAFPGLIYETDEIATSVAVDYTKDGKVVAFDVYSAPKRINCHYFSTQQVVDNKPALAIHWDYDEAKDELAVFLLAAPSVYKRISTDDSNIDIGCSVDGHYHAFFFRDASVNIAG